VNLYEVRNGILYNGKSELGADDVIYVDGRQDVAESLRKGNRKKVSIAKLPEGDYVMVTPAGLTVGIEEKKANDLASSLRSRRLQRQLRRLEKAVDIPLLGLRFNGRGGFRPVWWQLKTLSLPMELLKWSLRGGILLLPHQEDKVLSTLRRARNILQPGRHLFTIVSGSDKKIKGESRFKRAVQRMIEGVGPSAADKLSAYYEDDIKKLLYDNEEGWHKAGLNIAQRAALGELTNENKCNSTG
jgi:hypothetical protein